MVSMFELGRQALRAETLKRYAKAIRSRPSEVQRRFLEAKLLYHEAQAREARSALSREHNARPRRGRPIRGTA